MSDEMHYTKMCEDNARAEERSAIVEWLLTQSAILNGTTVQGSFGNVLAVIADSIEEGKHHVKLG